MKEKKRKQTKKTKEINVDWDKTFSMMWGHIVAAVSVVFDTTEDPAVLEKAIGGFHLCAAIASYYVFSDVLDNLVVSFPSFSFFYFFIIKFMSFFLYFLY